MEKENICGYIYKITNKVNGMCYIGKTTYSNIQKRFNQHIYYALIIKGGTQKTIHQAIRDFGIENFQIENIYTVKAPEILEDKEKEFIALYHSWIKDPECNGYNQSKGGEGTHYCKNNFNEELSEKILSLYEEKQNQNEVARQLNINVSTVKNYLLLNNISTLDAKTVTLNSQGKKVAVYNGEKLVAIYPSIGQANAHIKGTKPQDVGHISEICNEKGGRKTLKGFTFKFTEKELFNENMMLDPKDTNYIPKNKKKKFQMIDKTTKEVLEVFESGSDAGRYFNLPKPGNATTCISRAIERNGTWRGYEWKILI